MLFSDALNADTYKHDILFIHALTTDILVIHALFNDTLPLLIFAYIIEAFVMHALCIDALFIIAVESRLSPLTSKQYGVLLVIKFCPIITFSTHINGPATVVVPRLLINISSPLKHISKYSLKLPYVPLFIFVVQQKYDGSFVLV
jgi:hypothetical protein